jgi:hypothetical protein
MKESTEGFDASANANVRVGKLAKKQEKTDGTK